jgi:hypothetical protein
MPSNKDFDRKNPKKKFELEQGQPVENVPYEGPFAPRFEPKRMDGRRTETETGLPMEPHVFTTPAGQEPQPVVSPLNVEPNQRSTPWYRRRYVSVLAWQESVLLDIDIQTGSASGTFYIKHIGHTFVDNSVEFRLVYDDLTWMRWNFQLGGVGSTGAMYMLNSALPVRRKAQLIVRNLTDQTRLYEAVLDGWFAETAGVGTETGFKS